MKGNDEGNTAELQSLLDRAAAGHDEAHQQLIEIASERLLKLTRRMLRDFPRLRRWEQTDDVFQEATLRLYRSLEAVRPETVQGFFGLAATQIRRTLISLARHHFGAHGEAARHHSDGQATGDRSGVLGKQPDQGLSVDSLDSWARFHEAVEALQQDEREVFELVWYGGMQQKEVASILGVSVPTVQRRWYRAQHRLGQAMQGDPPV